MNRVHFLKLLALSFVLAATAVACKKNLKGVTAIPGPLRPPPGPPPTASPAGGDQGLPVPGPTDTTSKSLKSDQTGIELAGIDRGNYIGDYEQFKQQTIYFAFDNSEVKPAEKPKLDVVAEHLKANPTCKVEIEGHCDERGTEGYNLSLGERRALSAREYLISVGIAGERVGVITYGETKPAIQGHDETAWQKNRRGEFLLLKPKTQ
ncbi:MAG: OmpA family protein [Verrucomicrobia bacterium]|nr:OmpA family protein [Verrucomicrobiota bacterium]